MQWIDLRSDTVTQPTDEMRAAMAAAPVGDDVYGDDPTVRELEALAAKTMGKQAAMFVPSGTMGNQVSIMTHTRRGDEVICSENAHIVLHEVGATAVLSGVCLRTIKTEDDQLTAETVERAIRPEDIHMPHTGLVEMENALSNGTVMPLEKMKEVYETAHRHGLPVHLDGARIFNAAAALGVEAKEIAQYGDSVMFCLSKGLCAPVGSMVCGSEEFIARARKNRKILGGGMRQCGILAAAGIIAIEKMAKRVTEDHENARYFAQKLAALPGITVDRDAVQISMIFFTIDKGGFDHETFPAAMKEKGILVNGIEDGKYRFVTHYWMGKKEIDQTVDALAQLLA
ncbi:MAG: low-specificity L-threonine aldolase [Oscillospiraceae bacterium]|nr:low-specificity L-threonine aldolase [Oscillospiraceae bacterium]